MAEEPPALPSSDDILELPSGDETINPEPGYSKDLVEQAEEVRELVNSTYQKAMDRRNLDNRGIDDEGLDEELVTAMALEIPEAVEELGREIERAREVERSIAGPGDTEVSDSIYEEEFLENYREAEGVYREVFQQMDQPVGGRNMVEYLDNRYRIDFVDCFKEVPDPRANKQ
ncbi:hypothetical protein GKQ38_05600 [Candidatus Nanohaloarchaea archaeon]|nr:hypothetical protein GKQ38_05600 [Candidatus Nanohaloarchaea archaeon]